MNDKRKPLKSRISPRPRSEVRLASAPAAGASKLRKLQTILRSMENVVVAFSGGVDSSVLLRVAAATLGRNVYAVIAASPTYPAREIRSARALARALKVRHEVITTAEMDNPEFTANAPLRCYHCKRELILEIRRIADRKGVSAIVDGQNADDVDDYRPGARAAAELGVRSPLREAGLRKDEIRALAKRFGLPNWSKPAQACLASRFPYHTPITADALRRVAGAEGYLRRLGFGQLRVRHHGPVARIELLPAEISRIARPDIRRRIVAALKKLGYLYVAVDLAGYRTGSLNEALPGAAVERGNLKMRGKTKKKEDGG